ncbi:hypothetical protein [Microlunatus soli]|uniref:Uncharacterized protein n=1 Tax=Microlunatus soli TaxID=630515 RepID=A0A1H1X6J4_9ACTN|nr:hypothetical protein [Microlunatus soli]SDT04710.1 hypothetical protein SAMN04489812_3943 [Microlunatus soli]
MIAGWMILIALIVGAVLMLGRTHRRADPHAWTAADSDHFTESGRDADRRRGRQELRLLAAAHAVRDGLTRVGSDLNRAARFDRARAELMEPGSTAPTTAAPSSDRTSEPDDHSLAA